MRFQAERALIGHEYQYCYSLWDGNKCKFFKSNYEVSEEVARKRLEEAKDVEVKDYDNFLNK